MWDRIIEKEINIQEWKKKYDLLIEEWKESAEKKNLYKSDKDNPLRGLFISDGIACPEIWFKQNIRPLFIQKEAYDNSGTQSSWDEAEWFLSGKHKQGKIAGKTWKKVCAWAHDIFHNPCNENNFKWNDPILQQIAIINIKKYGGWLPSSESDLKKHAEEYAAYIYKQIVMINPTVIVCGNTKKLLDIVWEKLNKGIIKKVPQGRVYPVKTNEINAVLIDFWHPSCRQDHSKEWKEDMISFYHLLEH